MLQALTGSQLLVSKGIGRQFSGPGPLTLQPRLSLSHVMMPWLKPLADEYYKHHPEEQLHGRASDLSKLLPHMAHRMW